jgi:glycine/D-amino acid oxidase-like deaminating enzyme
MRVAVVGAGLQGCCTALELARRGAAVDLFDRADGPMTRASRHNEGKVHLGYIYGADPSLRSAAMMIEGALTFAPLLNRWLGGPAPGGLAPGLRPSAPFLYAVHRTSQVDPDRVAKHLARTHELIEDHPGRGDYFGVDLAAPSPLGRRELQATFDPGTVVAAHCTAEVSIDPIALAGAVRRAIAGTAGVTGRYGCRVERIALDPDGRGRHVGIAGIAGGDGAEPFADRYDHVVNAAWDGRLTLDATAGVVPDRPWLWRVKYYLRLRTTAATAGVASTSIVLGPYGDVVDHGDGHLYLSWYPAGMEAVSDQPAPPDWPSTLDGAHAGALREGIVAGLAEVMPAVRALPPDAIAAGDVQGGAIFAWGATDIDDPASGLHDRFEIGPRSLDRYHTIDTGKLTTAPLFAVQAAERIAPER